MFTHKDIEIRSLFVINGTEHQSLRVCNGRLLLEDTEQNKIITKLPFPKIDMISGIRFLYLIYRHGYFVLRNRISRFWKAGSRALVQNEVYPFHGS